MPTFRVKMLQEILLKTFYGNTVFMWGYALVIIFLFVIGGKILYWISKNIFKRLTSKTKTKLDDILVDMIEEPAVFAVFVFGLWIGLNQLNISEASQVWWGNVFQFLIVLNVAWFLARFFDAIFVEYLAYNIDSGFLL